MKIEKGEKGLIFLAYPVSSDSLAKFRIISAAENSFVSYNTDHDFPQRIEYYLTSRDRLKAFIKNNSRSVVFVFTRVEVSYN